MSTAKKLSLQQAEQIADAVVYRREHYPTEPLQQAVMVVLLNFGDRYAPVSCMGPEQWTGQKEHLPITPGIPLCPNGHPLLEGRGKALALMDDEEEGQ